MAKRNSTLSNLNSGLAMIGITLVIGLVAVNVYTDEREMRAQEKTYIEREAALNREIEDEEQRTKLLNEQKKYVATNQYIKEVAREKLGLLDPDEVLIKAKDE
jgi:cell division protein DivIC